MRAEHATTCRVYAPPYSHLAGYLRAGGRWRSDHTRMGREQCTCARSDLSVRIRQARRIVERKERVAR